MKMTVKKRWKRWRRLRRRSVRDIALAGIGVLPSSGLGLTPEYREYDAVLKFGLEQRESREAEICRAGEVLTGQIQPSECQAFGTRCTPEKPLGAPMVSTEGACAAYYRYR